MAVALPVMAWWAFLVWGVFGSVLVEGLDLAATVRRRGDWPWIGRKTVRATPYLTMLAVRAGLGGGLALGIGLSEQIATPVAAITVGVATPLIVARLSEATDPTQGGDQR